MFLATKLNWLSEYLLQDFHSSFASDRLMLQTSNTRINRARRGMITNIVSRMKAALFAVVRLQLLDAA